MGQVLSRPRGPISRSPRSQKAARARTGPEGTRGQSPRTPTQSAGISRDRGNQPDRDNPGHETRTVTEPARARGRGGTLRSDPAACARCGGASCLSTAPPRLVPWAGPGPKAAAAAAQHEPTCHRRPRRHFGRHVAPAREGAGQRSGFNHFPKKWGAKTVGTQKTGKTFHQAWPWPTPAASQKRTAPPPPVLWNGSGPK